MSAPVNRAKAVKEQRKELQAQKKALQEEIQAGGEAGAVRALRFRLAGVEEDLIRCNRELASLLPRHRVRAGGKTNSAFALNRDLYQKWFEAERGQGDNGEQVEVLRQSVRAALLALSPRQQVFLQDHLAGMTGRAIAEKHGVNPATVSKALKRGKENLTRFAGAITAFREAGGVDLDQESCLKAFCDLLSPRQILYISLYYGEWMNCREIGELLGVDHTAVFRTIRRGLFTLALCTRDGDGDINMDVDRLEDLLFRHYSGLIPPPPERTSPPAAPPEGFPWRKTATWKAQRARPFYGGLREKLSVWVQVNGYGPEGGCRLRGGQSSGRLRVWLETLRGQARQTFPRRWRESIQATLEGIVTKLKRILSGGKIC